MHCSTILKITYQGDTEAVDIIATMVLQFFLYRIKVQQSLAGMFVGPIASIDNRHSARFRKFRNRPFLGVTHSDHIAVATKHSRRVI